MPRFSRVGGVSVEVQGVRIWALAGSGSSQLGGTLRGELVRLVLSCCVALTQGRPYSVRGFGLASCSTVTVVVGGYRSVRVPVVGKRGVARQVVR